MLNLYTTHGHRKQCGLTLHWISPKDSILISYYF